ncbi:MAG: TolC family protein [Flavobacteriales bacterium]
MKFGKKKIKNLIFWFIVSAGLAKAQSFSLKQAQDHAVENYFESVNAGLDIKKSKARIWENTAMGLPQVNASGSYRYAADLEFDFDLSGGLPPGQDFIAVFAADNISQGKIEASQLIFDGSYIVGLQAAKKYYEFTKLDKEKTNNEVKKMVSSSYYLVLVADENIKFLEASFQNMDASIKETNELVEQGFLDETELDQLMLLKSDLEITLQSAKQSKDVALKMLKLNLGLELGSNITLSDSLTGIMEEINLDALLGQQFDAAENPELKVLQAQRDLLSLNVKRFKAQRLPTVAAFYAYQNTAYQFDWNWLKDASWYDAQNIGVSVSIPLLSSGQQGAVIKQAKLELIKMENTLVYAERAFNIQFTNAINNLNVKNANYGNSKKSLLIAKKIFDRTQIKYQEGLSSSFELSQIKNQVLQSQGKYIQSLFDVLNAKAELDKLQNK